MVAITCFKIKFVFHSEIEAIIVLLEVLVQPLRKKC